MKKRLQLLPLLLAAIMLLGACASNTPPGGGSATSTTATATTAGTAATTVAATTEDANIGPAILRMNITLPVATFNPHTAEQAVEYMHQQWINANLYKRMWDQSRQDWYWAPELADGEPIDVNGDGKTWHIKMQQGFTFEDGRAMNAEVVEYTMQMALDPKLASRNSGIGKTLENGDPYLLGEVTSWDDVGINVIDEYTIEFVITDVYVPYDAEDLKTGLAHVGAGLLHPEKFEECFNADRTENTYGTTPERFVAGGAYSVTGYIDGQYMEVSKRLDNGHPYLVSNMWTPDMLQLYVVNEDNTALQMYQNGELDIVKANTREYDDYPDVYYLYTPDNYGIFINSESKANPVLQDYNFRYAMYWGFDREKCLNIAMPTNRVNPYHYSWNVTSPDPADKAFRVVMREQPESQAIRMDGKVLTDLGFDATLALEYFDKAYTANGSKKIEVEMQYSEGNEERKAWAEAIQYHFNELFGADKFNMTLRAVPHASIYENMSRHGHNTGEMPFDMSCTAGIYQDIIKPWDNSNWTYSGPDVYSSQYTLLGAEAAAEWDKLYYECTMGQFKGTDSASLKGKIANSARMEEILFNECTFIPAYTRGNRYLIAENITIPFDGNVGDAYIEFALMQAEFN